MKKRLAMTGVRKAGEPGFTIRAENPPMKIFKMNEFDWWMDTDLESAKKNYTEYCEEIDTDPADIKKACELTNEQLDKHMFLDEEGYHKCSFREEMNSIKQVPQFFASTEY